MKEPSEDQKKALLGSTMMMVSMMPMGIVIEHLETAISEYKESPTGENQDTLAMSLKMSLMKLDVMTKSPEEILKDIIVSTSKEATPDRQEKAIKDILGDIKLKSDGSTE